MTVPEGFDVKLFAGEPDVHAADRLLPRRPRPALGGRGVQLSARNRPRPDAARRRGSQGRPHPDLRGHRRRRQVRQAHRLHGRPEPRQRPRSRLRRRLDRRGPVSDVRPDQGGEDKPAGPPQILLDGWGYQDTHETLNTFTWGPDGWLYGCHGVFTHSQRRQAGHAGQGPHPASTPASGAIIRRSTSSKSSPRAPAIRGASTSTTMASSSARPASSRTASTSSRAAAISGRRASTSTRTPTTTSDHRRSPALRRRPTRTAATASSDSAGGGHAHCGLMCYLGGAWPEEYRGQLFMGNIHGHRLNVDIPEAEGLRLRRPSRPGFPARQRRLGALHQPALRPGRQRLPDRLVRQAGLPPDRSPKSGTAPTAASTRSATAARSR